MRGGSPMRVHLQQGLNKLQKQLILCANPILEGGLLRNKNMIEVVLHIKDKIFLAEIF